MRESVEDIYSGTSIIRHSLGLKIDVRVQRLSDYPVSLSTVKHGDCPSVNGQTGENVGLLRCWITEVPLYRTCFNVCVILFSQVSQIGSH